jgi:hypothetical protein
MTATAEPRIPFTYRMLSPESQLSGARLLAAPSNQTEPWSRQFSRTPTCDPPVTKPGHNRRGTLRQRRR